MKRFHRAIGLTVALLATAASLVYIARSWRGQDFSAYASPGAALGLACGVAFYLLSVPISAWAWRRLLADLDIAKPWRELTAILAITQIGKYLPGNVGQHVGRASMSLSRHIGPRPFLVTVAIEMLLVMLAGIVVGFAAAGVSGRALAILPAGKLSAVVFIAAIVIAAVIGLSLLRRFGPALLARYLPRHAGAFTSGALPSTGGMLKAFAIYCLAYLAIGTGIVLMARLLVPAAAPDAWLLLAGFALAWVVGFVTPGAPAGLGVREGVMLLILSGSYRAADAGAIVIALRLATTLGDILLLLMGLVLVRTSGQRSNPRIES